MDRQTAAVLTILIAYITLIILIGFSSMRFGKRTLEDFLMGSREFRAIVLFSSVFGANISAVALIGIPGLAYHVGWVAWAYFVTAWAWLTPLFFYILGRRAWILGKRFGYMTQAEIMGARWRSPVLSLLVSSVLLVYTVPYLMTGLRGIGITLEMLTNGFIPFWIGALVVALVVLGYVLAGGMRGAAWVNTLQTAVFLSGGLLIFVAVASVLGGPAEATARIANQYPELLSRDAMPWKQFFSYGFIIALGPALFPQIFMRFLTGKDPKTLRQVMAVYPLPALLVLFLMAYVGMWGRAVMPDLEGGQSDVIMPMLLAHYTPVWVTGILGASILAAMMSTMDSQLLVVTAMITRDFLTRTGVRTLSQARLVILNRCLVASLTALAYGLSLYNPTGIIRIVEFAFSGFAVLMPAVLACLYWKRSTSQAAIISVATSQAVLVALSAGWIDDAWTFGFMPGLVALVVGSLALIVVTYMTRPGSVSETEEFFSIFAPSSGAARRSAGAA